MYIAVQKKVFKCPSVFERSLFDAEEKLQYNTGWFKSK